VPVTEYSELRSGLELLTCSLRACGQALQGCARACKSRISKRLSSLRVLRVAPYCVPGGIRVRNRGPRDEREATYLFGVSISSLKHRLRAWSIPSLAQGKHD
jgi:hypothetical protein